VVNLKIKPIRKFKKSTFMQNHFATAIIVWEGGYCIFFEILIIPANGRVAGSWELASGRNIWQSAFAGYGLKR
jgi:hypothetical protein